ncbi:hypothetical protein BJ508DRAFT_313806 [Ascobolus immersus RN42]|uniref:Uncharacterized protein n=1 Tax=Ascobolus immersus RN42 TaxID=1160509 RepID=A0A3N4HHH9_ASCIM|nr:hypothetical protein BJ508DRAFT_313806 [Ascobolus immersus RN42]
MFKHLRTLQVHATKPRCLVEHSPRHPLRRSLTTKQKNHLQPDYGTEHSKDDIVLHTFKQYNHELLSIWKEMLTLKHENLLLRGQVEYLRRKMADPVHATGRQWSVERGSSYAHPESTAKEAKRIRNRRLVNAALVVIGTYNRRRIHDMYFNGSNVMILK